MNVPTKFEVRSFTRSWDNRGTQKIWAVPGYAHAPFFSKILTGFIRIGPVNVPAKFEVRSITRSWDNTGVPKKFGQSLNTPTLPFPKNF